MANYDDINDSGDTKKPDGYANIYINTKKNGVVKHRQLGKFGVELDRSRKLDAAIIRMAESNSEALNDITVSIRVALMNEKKSNDF